MMAKVNGERIEKNFIIGQPSRLTIHMIGAIVRQDA